MNGNMKKAIAVFLSALLLCALCGCGQPKTEPETPAQTAEPVTSEEVQAPEQGSGKDVQSYVGLTIEDFIRDYGEPLSSEYAPSCMGPGEDGTHGFTDWTVYTYKENGVETIRIIVPAM